MEPTADRRLWRIARSCMTGARWTFAVVGIVVVLSSVLGLWLNNHLSSALSSYSARSSQSEIGFRKALDATGIDFREGLVVLVRSDSRLSATTPPPPSVMQVQHVLASVNGVQRVVDYATDHSPTMISKDGRSTYVVGYVGGGNEKTNTQNAQKAMDAVPSLRGQFVLGGPTVGNVGIAQESTKDLGLAETVAFPVVFILMLFIFRGLIAALLPLISATVTITAALVLLMPFVATLQISVFALELIFALGLGLSIDFSLLVVTRYREEVAVHGVGLTAIRAMIGTAGRTVCFSALTISVALASLFVFPIPYLYSMAIAGILVSLCAAVSAVIVLPTVLLKLGKHVDSLAPARWRQRSEQAGGSRFWYRWPHFVMRRAVPLALVVVVIMLGLASLGRAPRFSGVDSYVLPTTSNARVVADNLTADFPGFQTQPAITLVQGGQGDASAVTAYARKLRAVPHLTVTQPRYSGKNLWVIESFINAEPLSVTAQSTVHAMRAVSITSPRWVTGTTANFVDMTASVARGLPWAGLIVALAVLIVLFALTGSVILPVKALLMNVLTLGAAFGALVWGFQHGHLQGALGFTSNGTLESSTPVLIGALVIGLSTDYEVFLLGRIKEAHDHGESLREAVAVGLEHTGRVVTAAALLFCVAIGALVISRIEFVKELGFGAAFAVFVDATLVRAVLVPALMLLLGRWNWWAPGPLARLHSRVAPPVADLERAGSR